MSMSLFVSYIEYKVNHFQYLFCFKVSNAIGELASLDIFNSQHKELASAHFERDDNDFLEILTWVRNRNPSTASEKLVCMDSGFIKKAVTVNCDKAETIGARIQKSKVFASCSFKRKDLYSSITVGKECVAIDPLALFLRLVT